MDRLVKKSAYPVGKTVTWQSFSSSSRSQHAASGFVQMQGSALSGSLFVIQSICAKKIEYFSAMPAEQEVLFLPNSQFKVLRKLETQEEKEQELDELDAYNMDSLHVYILKQLS